MTVSIRVSQPPLVTDDAYTIDEDTPLSQDGASGLLSNDTDPDNDTLQAVLISGPAHGSVSIGPDGSFTYQPSANYNGSDSFVYGADDSGGPIPGTVTITINPVNDAPYASDYGAWLNPGASPTLNVPAPGVLHDDGDIDGDSLTAALITQAANGTAVVNSDGSYSYTPNPGFHGYDSFVYAAGDGTLQTQATVTILVARLPDVHDDAYTTDEDTPLIVGVPGVLANDNDPYNEPLSAYFTFPQHGTLFWTTNGGFTYTPNPNYNGADSMSYSACDVLRCSDWAEVTITVNPVNDAPVAANDGPYAFDSSLQSSFSMDAAYGLLLNDTDADTGDTLSAVLVTPPAHGIVVLNPDGSFTYTPNHSYAGTDSFTYRASDSHTTSNLATVSFNVSNTRDVILTSLTADGTYLNLAYNVTGGAVSPFYIGLYASPDGITRGRRLEVLAADGSGGSHALNFIPFFEDPSAHYYLLAMVDADDTINETHETNNAAALADGAFLLRDTITGQRILEIQQSTTPQATSLSLTDGQLTLDTRDLTNVSHTLTDDDSDLGFLDVTGDTKFHTEDGEIVTETPGTISLLDAQTIAYDIVHTDRLWQNPNNRWDVTGDGFVAPNDVIAISNILTPFGPHLLDHPRGTPGFLAGTDAFLDVNGDNVVSQLDLLEVTDKVNNHSGTLTPPHQNPTNSLDVNNDGLVNSDDEQAILHYLADLAKSQGAPTTFSKTYDNSIYSTIGQFTVRQHYPENILVTDDGLINMAAPQIDVYTLPEDSPNSNDDGIPYWLLEFYQAVAGQSPFPTWWYDGIGAPSNGDLDRWLGGIRESKDPPPYTLLNGVLPDWLLDLHKALYGVQAFPDWWYDGIGAPSVADISEFAYGLKPAFMGGSSSPTVGPCSPGTSAGTTVQDPSNPDQDITNNTGVTTCVPPDPPSDVVANNDGEPDLNGDFPYWTFDTQELDVSSGDGVLKNDKNASNATGSLEAHLCTTAILGCQQPQHGTVSLNTNGSFTFIPTPGFSGLASFMYYAEAQDGRKSAPAKATVAVDTLEIYATARGTWADPKKIGGTGGPTDTPNDIWAGQAVDLSVVGKGPQLGPFESLPKSATYLWTLGGNVVSDFHVVNGYQDPANSSSLTPFAGDLRTNSAPKVFWVDAGQHEVKVTINVFGHGPLKASGVVTVHRPSVNVVANTSGTYSYPDQIVDQNGVQNGYSVEFGKLTPNGVKGIDFSLANETGGSQSGGYQWVQLTSVDVHYQKIDGNTTTSWMRISPGLVLDDGGRGANKVYPYDSGFSANDSPLSFLPDGIVSYSRHDDFQMYLMWKWRSLADSADAIFVPLRVTVWHWGFVAGFAEDAGWVVFPDPNNSENPPDDETTAFPEWQSKASKVTLDPDT